MLLDEERIVKTALKSVQDHGIVFLDEIDKVCANSETNSVGIIEKVFKEICYL